MAPTKQRSYDLGLDIGIASVGWCVLGQQHIIDLGVRAFDKAESSDGNPLNLQRRSARLLRRRLRRRAWRLLKLARLLKKTGLIADSQFFKEPIQKTDKQTAPPNNIWELRVAGLSRLLNNEEWARVIYHICKHRGFWFARKVEDEGSEGGMVKDGLDRTRKLMQENGYRTAAEMMLVQFPKNQRNKRGDYSQSLGRELLANELRVLFECQRSLGNPNTSAEFEQRILHPETGLLWQQKPALSGEAMLKLIGKCTFDKTEYRAAKHTWSAERFVWLTKLNNLRFSINGENRGLNADERAAVINLPYEKAKLTFKQLKAHLIKIGYWNDTARFAGLNYQNSGKDPEETKLIELTGWHELRTTLEKAGLKTEWQGLATQPALLDAIGSVLSIYKTDDEIRAQLNRYGLAEAVVEALLNVSFKDFIRLSLKALNSILPLMEAGQRYDEACINAGFHHSQLPRTCSKIYLPALDEDAPNNPVVKRALNQARKVVNALIKRYGSPNQVHIEMARDLSRPPDERQKIEKAQKEFADNNEKDRQLFEEHFHRRPNGREFEKWQLYREQSCKCAYSLAALDLNRVINDLGYAEVDHALPYSRSLDDSRNNKVLVLTRENQQKGNRTPFEYLNGADDSDAWQKYQAFVTSNKKYRQAKRDRLLRRQFGKEEASEFRERNLNDTRYACRYFKNFIERHLQLASNAKCCVIVSGQLTSFLRARWGLAKLRGSSDRHHAVDAAVVAACSHSMVKRLSDYARRKELEHARSGLVDLETGEVINHAMLDQLETHFPRPWPHFEFELALRAGLDRNTGRVTADWKHDEFCRQLAALGYSDDMLAAARPLFVSRAPKRRNGGAAHKDTVYARRPTDKLPNRVTQKVALTALKLSDLDPEQGTLTEPHRNQALYDALRERLEAFGGKAEKAFADSFYKPTRDGSQGPIVRTVTKVIENLSGIPLRGGVAKNDSMIRVDVFRKGAKYHLVPLYVQHRVAKELPNRAIVAAKDEKDWTVVDETFEFCFSLYPNDLVRVMQKGKVPILGYYRSTHSGTGNISIAVQDRNQWDERTTSFKLKQKSPKAIIPNDKMGLIEGIGVKTALALEKFNVDVLGNIYPVKTEVRRGLA